MKIGKLSVEIAPKFINRASRGAGWRSAMWRFLAYGHGIETLSDASGTSADEEGIADVIAELFLGALRGASARGYPLGYSERRFRSPFLRGRLDPRDYKRLLPVTGQLGVMASQLTRDVPTNRLLKWAGNQLELTVEDPGRRQQLRSWAGELPNVQSSWTRRAVVPSARRHHPHLAHAVEIAKMLADDRQVAYESGELTLPGFLWDSENLFERAVRRLFAEAARPLGLSVTKESLPLATTVFSGTIQTTRTTPDITVRRGKHHVLHADAKYKTLGEHPKNIDFYQVLSAGLVSSVRHVALMYPTSDDGISHRAYTPVAEGNPQVVSIAKVGLGSFSTKKGIEMLRSEMQSFLRNCLTQ
ncbi:hypothetical protein [Sphingosinicella sp. BN140058]|uniref:5-methylcytosine restriction system specificity protein McrC n=1 Tax=Sphingosinicella sp. BN140058 TaxID=1892855 RepID=UPI0013EA1798|nr:hypothetical protein [Sphingosinicella sp. BN140058]